MPVQRLKVAILPLDLPRSGPGNPFRGYFNHWQVSRLTCVVKYIMDCNRQYSVVLLTEDADVTVPLCLIALWAGMVGITTGYGLGGPRIESRRGRDFPHQSGQPPIPWVLGLFPGG